MGDFADDAEDRAFQEMAMLSDMEDEANEIWEAYERRVAEWQTKGGEIISVELMENSHIVNCLNLLNKVKEDFRTPTANVWIKIFKAECKKRKIKDIL